MFFTPNFAVLCQVRRCGESVDKQSLLKRYRRKKRLALLGFGLAALVSGVVFVWWLPLVLALLAWLAHEAWFSDHLFYAADQDYEYRFQECEEIALSVENGRLLAGEKLPVGETLVLEIKVRGDWRSRFFDPYVEINGERFDFERGVSGRRYLNISNQATALATGEVPFNARFCRVEEEARLSVFNNPDFTRQRLMLIAPHADDAELAAFNLYRQTAEVLIVTLTQGELEAENYIEIGLSPAEASRLKGRLRSWDSIAVPLWGGLAQGNCVQLGYFCMQLPAMQRDPAMAFASRVADETDIRRVRGWNRRILPSDQDGLPSWNNLIADLTALIDEFRPEVIVTPHPRRDPHPDHVAATQAVIETCRRSTWKPESFLLYANHLHDNDRWPMGPTGEGMTLPPSFDATELERFWSLPVSPEAQIDKAMALGMQHDLTPRLPFKKRLRRRIQTLLAGRCWPKTGENEYFRKAVRSHELFHVRRVKDFLS